MNALRLGRPLREVRDALHTLTRTGLLQPAAWPALLRLARCVLRHGPSLYAVMAWNAGRWPERAALHERGHVTTFRALRQQADDLADRLHPFTASSPEGPLRVALLCRNHAAFVALLLACARLGLNAVLLNTSFSPAQLQAVCRAEHVELLLCDDDFGPLLESSGLPVLTVSALQRAAKEAPKRWRLWRPLRRATVVLLTSGTTGQPKPVQRASNPWPLLRSAAVLLEHLRPQVGAPTLLTLPLFHGHGLATLGLSLMLAAPLHLFARGRPDGYWRCLQDEQIEVLVLVPTVLYRLLHAPEAGPLPALRTIVCGSAPLSAALAAQTRALFGAVLFNLYGSSEAGLISLATPADLLAAPGTVGRALPGVEVAIQSASGVHTTGPVLVRGAQTAGLSPRVRGFLQTGDVGHLDASGRLFLAGRLDDVMVIGGENVSPEMIEERLLDLPYVLECGVSALPSPEFGQAIHAHVVLKAGTEQPGAAAIAADLCPLLPRMLRPVRISVVEALPRSPTGKLLRRLLTSSGTG